jgi:hypothetical protein
MQNNFNEWARYVHNAARHNTTLHEINDEKNNRRFSCYADGPYHAAHMYFCQFGVYPYGATVTNKVKGTKQKLK